MNPGPGPDLTIVLLGNSGVGKSSSGNTILGRREFESKESFTSVTKQISAPITGTVSSKQISVIDTPGILESETQIQTLCQELLNSSKPCLFLVVVKIDRFTTEQKNAVEAAIRVIGDQGFTKCYLLFTAGDILNDKTLDEFINEDPEGPLPPLVQRFAGRYHVFTNKNGKPPHQVIKLLEKSGHLTDAARPAVARRSIQLCPPGGGKSASGNTILESHQFRSASSFTSATTKTTTSHPFVVRRSMLLGLPGVGKSASGNTILGSNQFRSEVGFTSVTTETTCKSAMVEGRHVSVVDTPGFSDEVLTVRQLYLEIIKTIAASRPGPHAFIIVVRISRLTKADIVLFKMLEKLFGKDAQKYAMILFTYGDQLGVHSIEGLIQANKHLSELVSKCGGRFCVFNNTQKTNRVQVQTLLDKIDQMVNVNGEAPYTNEMFKNAQRGITYIRTHVPDWFIALLNEIKALLMKLLCSFSENSSRVSAPALLSAN